MLIFSLFWNVRIYTCNCYLICDELPYSDQQSDEELNVISESVCLLISGHLGHSVDVYNAEGNSNVIYWD